MLQLTVAIFPHSFCVYFPVPLLVKLITLTLALRGSRDRYTSSKLWRVARNELLKGVLGGVNGK